MSNKEEYRKIGLAILHAITYHPDVDQGEHDGLNEMFTYDLTDAVGEAAWNACYVVWQKLASELTKCIVNPLVFELEDGEQFIPLTMNTDELAEGYVTEVWYHGFKIAEFTGPFQEQFARRLISMPPKEKPDD